MKKVFKLLPLALLLIALAAFSACSSDDDNDNDGAGTGTGTGETAQESSFDIRIALVAHSPESVLDDGSFNNGARIGIENFLSSQGASTVRGTNWEFFQPHAGSDDARIDLIEDAINAGFDVLVLPGFHFVNSLYDAQDMFPDTTFILLDASPGRDGVVRIENNLVAVHYAEEQSGFLAGYAAVVEGFRNLGFMGGAAVPAVVRFGHGFIQGAEHAAYSLGLAEGDVEINFTYLGGFQSDPAIATEAGAWYAAGTEVIFAAAGAAGFSVISAADGAGAAVIGVDVDQSGDGDVVITSAVKGLAESVQSLLQDFLDGSFPGGQEVLFDAAVNGVGLPLQTSRFSNFTQSQYDAIFAQLANRSINVNNSLEMSDIRAQVSLVVIND